MALIIKDRVQETSTTSGTGTLTLAGAVTGYQSFGSAIGSGNTTYYGIYETQTTNWEVGIGTVGSGTLARTTVLASSNAGSLVSFGGGQLAVWGDYPAGKSVNLDESGYVSAGGNPYVALNPQGTNPTVATANMWYSSIYDCYAYYNSLGYEIDVGQQVDLICYNSTGSTIPVGSVVYITGQHSHQPTISLGQANALSTSGVVGITGQAISNNSNGTVVILGQLNGVNTSGFTAGDILYLSPTTPGGITNTAPTSPNYAVRVGFCVYSNPSQGVIFTSVRNSYVATNNIVGQVPVANGGTGASTLTGYVYGNGTSSMTASTTIPTTALSGTITNAQLANSSITINGTTTSLGGSINVGTVTSVSGTAPVVSSGGSTPTISMAAANSTTNGYLTSTDWNTFNNKSPAAGSTSIVTVGTITTGVWNGTAIANSYLANSSITINGTPVSLGGSTTVSASAGGSNTQVQYNSSGTFAGSANMTFDGTSLTAGNLISTNGLYGKATFTGSYTDGIVVDYSTGNGRISVGTSDTLTFYNGGLANTTLGSFSTSGLLQAVGGFQAPSTGPFFLNATTISANFTVPSNYNAVTAGKVTINTGVTVTVSTGSRWVVV